MAFIVNEVVDQMRKSKLIAALDIKYHNGDTYPCIGDLQVIVYIKNRGYWYKSYGVVKDYIITDDFYIDIRQVLNMDELELDCYEYPDKEDDMILNVLEYIIGWLHYPEEIDSKLVMR